MLRRCLVAVALAGASLLGGASAGASTGVSITVGTIAVRQQLGPGAAYNLPVFGVRNPGTQRATYRLGVTYLAGQTSKQPPESWFRFAPRIITLRPGETRSVRTRLELPVGADPGDYAALIGPALVSSDQGPQVGARAAARLTFVVEESSALGAWWRRLDRLLSDAMPWILLVPSLVVLALAARRLRSRYSITVARRS